MSIILRAAMFAAKAHWEHAKHPSNRFRKHNGRLYITHPARVAAATMLHRIATENIVAAAWLHDVPEDTTIPIDHITELFGEEVSKIVSEMTNTSVDKSLPRPVRKKIDRERLKTCSHVTKIIKLLDRTDNLWELQGADTKFKLLYADESLLLLDEALAGTDEDLEMDLRKIINTIKSEPQHA